MNGPKGTVKGVHCQSLLLPICQLSLVSCDRGENFSIAAARAGTALKVVPAVKPNCLSDSQLMSDDVGPLDYLRIAEEKVQQYCCMYALVLDCSRSVCFHLRCADVLGRLFNGCDFLQLQRVKIPHNGLQSQQLLKIDVQHLPVIFSKRQHYLHNHVYLIRPDTGISSSYRSQHQKPRWFW